MVEIEEHGEDQTVLLPAEFRLPGKRARATRVGKGVLLEPEAELPNFKEIWAEIDTLLEGKFMEEGRQQPPMPPRDDRESLD